MKNVTISLEEKIANWVRIEAAKARISVSGYIAQLLNKKMEGGDSYEKEMSKYLNQKPFLQSDGSPYPKREDLYER